MTGTDHEAGQAVLQYLIELGHRSIAYVTHARFPGPARALLRCAGDCRTLRGCLAACVSFDEQIGFGEVFRTSRQRVSTRRLSSMPMTDWR